MRNTQVNGNNNDDNNENEQCQLSVIRREEIKGEKTMIMMMRMKRPQTVSLEEGKRMEK